MNNSAVLARAITWRSSKQSYLTAVLLADRALVDDCLRAYAYFRWADDRIDLELSSKAERIRFLEGQKRIVESCYQRIRPAALAPEEEMLADLIAHDRGNSDGLQSFIRNFFWVLDFDAQRRGRTVAAKDLEAYSIHLAKAVMDCIQYFIGNSRRYPQSGDRLLAVLGAHRTHMLRDLREDLAVGYTNIPVEDFPAGGCEAICSEEELLRNWTRREVERAAGLLSAGRRYIDTLDVLRCKLAGELYCARFERVLELITRDGYRLRAEYPERKNWTTWIRFTGLIARVIIRHWFQRAKKLAARSAPRPEQKPETP